MPHNLPEDRASLDISSVSDSGAGVAPGKSDASLHSRSDASTNRRDACPAIPDHELLKKIGDGSYGEVWLARSAVGTLRAVKIVWRKTFGHEHPFEREFKGIQRFEPISRSHEGMVDILQIGRGDGYFYYVMELADEARRNPDDEIRNPKEAPNDTPSPAVQPLPASDLGITSTFDIGHSSFYTPRTLTTDLARQRRLLMSECLQIGLSLTSALGHLHQNGLVHRDVKPSNIIFVGGVPKLADIGLVTEASEARSYVGTEGFIPPEGPGSPQADLYSLGKLLYEISTGKDRHAFPELPSDLAEQTEAQQLVELNAILLKACQNDVRERYQSAEEMHGELALLQSGKSVKRRRALGQRWKLARKIAVASAVLALAGAGTTFALRELNRNRPLSSDPEAQTLYEQAGYYLKSTTLDRTLQAITNLTEAVKRDPKFVDAYYRLFEAFFTEWADKLPPNQNGMANIKWVADKLKALRPNSAQYHTVNSWIEWEHWHYDQAIAEANLACRLNPRFLRAHHLYGWYMLVVRGDAATARKEFEVAERIDGSDVMLEGSLGCPNYFERNFPKAIELWNKAARLESRGTSTHGWLGWGYEADKQYEKALDDNEAYEKAVDGNVAQIEAKYRKYRLVLAGKGPREMWQAMLDEMRQSPQPDHYDIARLCARLGYTDEAFRFLEKAYHAHNGHMTFLLFDDCWDTLRHDPRFNELLERMGFSKVTPPRK